MPKNQTNRPNVSAAQPKKEAIGESEAFLVFQEQLSKAAKVDRPVLIVGERGTGKELAASRLHYLSPRWREPLVALNCAAIPPNLIESELFGYEAGAFTGANRRRIGRFESADEGTLFLDEIGNIPIEVQAKILRVVEYQTFERVGSSSPTQVDVRIVGATNADLPAMAATGRFQHDLLDRLSFEVLHIPPLRERHGDVFLLANYFSARMAHELGLGEMPLFSDEALAELETYHWPGNVRELKNVVERAVYRSETSQITEIIFDPFLAQGRTPPKTPVRSAEPEPSVYENDNRISEEQTPPDLKSSLQDQVAELETRLIKAALEKARYNQRKAADILGLSYHQFRGLYRKHGGKDLVKK